MEAIEKKAAKLSAPGCYISRYDTVFIINMLYSNNWKLVPEDQIKIIQPPEINSCDICYSDEVHCAVSNCGNFCKICRPCWDTYVALNKTAKKCPACSYHVIPHVLYRDIIISDYNRYKYFTCQECMTQNKKSKIKNCVGCSIKLCSNACGYEKHKPYSCDVITKWAYASSDKLTDIYIKENAKKCPNCMSYIIKDDMTCLKMHCIICDYIFCWNCLKDYSIHITNFYTCDEPDIINTNANANANKLHLISKYEEILTWSIPGKLNKYLKLAKNHIKYLFSLPSGKICVTYSLFYNILRVLNHDYEGFIYKLGLLNECYHKLMLMGEFIDSWSISEESGVPEIGHESIIYWDADYDHENPRDMQTILNGDGILNLLFNIGDVDLVTEYYYINFKNMTISDINDPPRYTYNICSYVFNPWYCPACTMYNRPEYLFRQNCTACYYLHENRKPENIIILR